MITQEWLLKFTTYKDGELWWKTKFTNACKVDKPIGCDNGRGYKVCRISGKTHRLHRLIWLYHYGEWPKDDIDHINGIRNDNRIENLRKATRGQNNYNKGSTPNTSSKYKGVYRRRGNKFVAEIRKDGIKYYLGSFDCEAKAAKAYDKKSKELCEGYERLNFG